MLRELYGVEKVKLVYGWSMGGMQAYHWAGAVSQGGGAHRRCVRRGEDRAA